MTTDTSVSSEPLAPGWKTRFATLVAPDSLVLRVARAPAAWLGLLIGLSTLARASIGIRVPSPWILPDEIVYSELAKSIADGGRPAVRGVPVFGWGEVYPTLVAPAWAVFADPVGAYHAALAINAVVMSAAAVPAYLLARMFVSRRASFLVAAMTVLVPSLAYTGVVMTENACYPVFLLAVWLVARAVRSPSYGNQAVALGGLALLAFTRIQGIALVGAYLAAVILYALTGSRAERWRYLRRFTPTAVVSVIVPLVPVTASVARGDGPLGWLGTRSGTFHAFRPQEIPEWFTYLTADLILYVAVAPALATAVVVARGLSKGTPDRLRLFAAVGLPTFAAMLFSVALVSASLDVDGTENLNERYVFYVVPLLFVGLALWIREDLPRRRRWAVALVAVCCLLAMVLPIDRLEYNANFQSVALLPWLDLSLSREALAVVVGIFALACGALWFTCPRDRVGRLWLLVGVWMAFVGVITIGTNGNAARNSAYAFEERSPTWVHDAVPGHEVPVLWDEGLARSDRPDAFSSWVMVTEFFNPEIGDVYRLGPPTYYETFLPTVPVTRAHDGTIVDAHGRRLDVGYLLVSCRTPVEGRIVAHAPRNALQLVRVDGPVRLGGARPCSRSRP